jgi:hypothetical protein
LLLLLLPLADITNWQRLAALENSGLAAEQRAAALRRQFKIYALESPLMWLIRAIAVVATATPVETLNVFHAVARQLAAPPNPIVAIALSLMSIAICAMTLSMGAYSASLCTLRYDILPALWPNRNRCEFPRLAQLARASIAGRHPILAYSLDNRWDIGVGVAHKIPVLSPPPRWPQQRTPLIVAIVQEDR